jgi:shikimate dehydrogenase
LQDLFAVIGDPIGHSVSPVMHEKWLKDNHLHHHYHAFRVKEADLKEAVKGLRVLGVKGFNVTIPHKMAIIPYLDDIDEQARTLGAVNTVINENGKLIGTNTDGAGLIHALNEKGFSDQSNDTILIIGAGGAARAVGLALARHFNKTVDFTNRSLEKAKRLTEEVSKYADSKALSMDEASGSLDRYQMVIQATPVGMSGFSNELPLSLHHLTPGTRCIDLIYKPLETPFLLEAKRKGGQVMNGLPMLIHQGAIAFHRWLGIYPDTQEMEFFLTQKL